MNPHQVLVKLTILRSVLKIAKKSIYFTCVRKQKSGSNDLCSIGENLPSLDEGEGIPGGVEQQPGEDAHQHKQIWNERF